eukprot:Nitzschia sp. Nitz4//scaffold230_size58257//10773//11732//NITZ4_006474-RA/size58257-processed-gene-0.49-mRNA-1//1//CDS//3329543229//5192//frame0
MVEETATTATTSTRPSNNSRGLGLPLVLHQILEDAEAADQQHIISWVADGAAFKIHQKEAFVEKILPKYFDASTFKSFQRSINLWNFQTVRKGPQKGFTMNPLFRKGDRELCKSMKRVRVKGTGKKRIPGKDATSGSVAAPSPSTQASGNSSALPNLAQKQAMQLPQRGMTNQLPPSLQAALQGMISGGPSPSIGLSGISQSMPPQQIQKLYQQQQMLQNLSAASRLGNPNSLSLLSSIMKESDQASPRMMNNNNSLLASLSLMYQRNPQLDVPAMSMQSQNNQLQALLGSSGGSSVKPGQYSQFLAALTGTSCNIASR